MSLLRGPSSDQLKCTRMPRGRGGGAEFVRNDIPERVAMQMTGHKTESVYRRYAIADERDLRMAVEPLNAIASAR